VTPIGWTFARKLFALLFDGTVPFVQSLFVKAGGSIQGRVILFLFRASSNHVSKRAGSYPIPASKISKEAREVMKFNLLIGWGGFSRAPYRVLTIGMVSPYRSPGIGVGG